MKPLRAVGYVRVSTGEQAAGGDSLDQQADAIQRWARYVDRRVCLFVEIASGKTMEKRPIFRDALQAAIQWKCPLVAYSMSRLARSTEDACRIRRELMQASPEAAIVMLRESIDTSTTAGKTFFGISAVIAEAERDWIAERTRDVLRFKQANGERYTKTAIYGTQWIATGSTLQLDGTTRPHFKAEPIESEQHVVDVIRLLVERGFGSTRIAALLNAANIPYRNSRPWTRNTVRPIVDRLKSGSNTNSIKRSASPDGD